MPDNPMCSPNEFIIHETTVTKKKIKEKASYMFYIPASTFKRRIKHPPGHAPCRYHLNIDRRKSNQWVSAVFFCAMEDGSQFFWLYRKVKRGMLNAKKKDHTQIWPGRNKDGDYGRRVPEKFYRPWWQQKKREQRNREAMKAKGYRAESYEEWKENDMRTELFSESLEEMMEKRVMLEVLRETITELRKFLLESFDAGNNMLKENMLVNFGNLETNMTNHATLISKNMTEQFGILGDSVNQNGQDIKNRMEIWMNSLNEKLTEVFQSVSELKQLIASALTDKGVPAGAPLHVLELCICLVIRQSEMVNGKKIMHVVVAIKNGAQQNRINHNQENVFMGHQPLYVENRLIQ